MKNSNDRKPAPRSTSNPLLWILVPLAACAGFGVACVARNDGAQSPTSSSGSGAGSEEVAKLREDVEALRGQLAQQADKLDELNAAFSQHFLVSGAYYTVTHVVDGDTFELGQWKIRLLGVNTPESVKPGWPVEWYGIESSNHMKKLILGKKVRLEPEAGERLGTGAYNRVLAYVFLEDGTDVNMKIVRDGYGQSYHKYPCKRRAEFDAAQAKAQAEKKGQWDDEARLAWEDTHVIPDVPAAEAKVIVAKSGMVHSTDCGSGPSVKNGTFFRSLEQAAKFGFTKLHSCAKKLQALQEGGEGK